MSRRALVRTGSLISRSLAVTPRLCPQFSRRFISSQDRPQAEVPKPSEPQPRPEPMFSAGTNPTTQLQVQLDSLLAPGDGQWKLTDDGKGLERSFKFKNFDRAWAFMSAVTARCKEENHHPEWANVASRVYIRWTTHMPRGLSQRDIQMAHFCDATAKTYAESFKGADEASKRKLSDLASWEKTKAQERRQKVASQIKEQWGMH
ncbi:pterin 4 alpha carbinolamine dehydratase-domain-containing protein [Podospora aff. communis PSN243]|uniref:4a-hydroxytetrahydrobiopterin dehydratase n=1 Tax=Podospora aff. communis PSN243 TaxID=3040156 RepID=A0AAV9GPF3_9PEZI|nr:pterin 4 alpha carbinolamine dehydratase-domain-containing protein [Podospora aff. communis PSN243]